MVPLFKLTPGLWYNRDKGRELKMEKITIYVTLMIALVFSIGLTTPHYGATSPVVIADDDNCGDGDCS